MQMDVKTQLHEGMKIAPIDKQDEEYSLILSSVDNKMYGVFRTTVIKLDDLDEDALNTQWICTNLNRMDEDIKCIEFAKDKWGNKNKIVSFEDFCIYSFSNRLDECDEDFESVDMRLINMKREDYMKLKGFTYEIGLRDKIKQFYDEKVS